MTAGLNEDQLNCPTRKSHLVSQTLADQILGVSDGFVAPFATSRPVSPGLIGLYLRARV